MISAKIILDSIANGSRLTTYILEYPRFIHSELMTHRVFSKNAASSRAIPIAKVIERIKQECAIPVEWGINNPGMQSKSLATEDVALHASLIWEGAMLNAISYAEELSRLGIHKQIVNRLLEPFSHIQVVLSGTEFSNFFELRTHPDAQPEFQVLAKLMKEEYDRSIPKFLYEGEWHLPFIDDINLLDLSNRLSGVHIPSDFLNIECEYSLDVDSHYQTWLLPILKKISVARCARVSYGLGERNWGDIDKDIVLYDRLVGSKPIHASPSEHQATNMFDDRAYGNFRGGWKQLRQFIEENN